MLPPVENKKLWVANYFRIISAGIISFLLFITLAIIVFTNGIALDKAIISRTHFWQSDWLTTCIRVITFMGNYQFLVPANLLLITYLILKKQKPLAIFVLFVAFSSLGWKFLLKELFHRPRPVDAMVTGIKNFSFPSGHALMGLAFYGLLILGMKYWVANKKLQNTINLFLLLLILLIGFSRIYLRVHYPSDVVAGYCWGIAWMVLCFYIFRNTKVYIQSGEPLQPK
jgi:membrane-associated phospholipid phosphatase